MRAAMLGAAVAIIWTPPWAAAQDPQAPQQQVSLEQALSRPGGELAGVTVPSAATFTRGDRTIAAGTTLKGPLAVVGAVRINGIVDGDVFSFGGDIVVPAGGHITGSAIAISGRVIVEGGAIDGEFRSLNGVLGPVEAPGPVLTTKDQVSLTVGWAVVALLVGIGVLVFGGRTLDSVAETVDRKFGKSFLVGIAATLGFAPALALLVVGLTLTILGILLVPFAIVAYALAVIGLIALGFLAAARAAGASFARGTYSGARGASLRALVYGLGMFVGVWLIAAVLTPFESIAPAARVLAAAITWAAATVGLGATIISRAGKRPLEEQPDPELERAHAAARRALEEAAMAPAAPPPPEWQTPTPVSGVVAARRSVPSTKAP